jgi:hypothetical protein
MPMYVRYDPDPWWKHEKLSYTRHHLWQPRLPHKRSSPSRRMASRVKGLPTISARPSWRQGSKKRRCQISNAGHTHGMIWHGASRKQERNLSFRDDRVQDGISSTRRTLERMGAVSFPVLCCDKMCAMETGSGSKMVRRGFLDVWGAMCVQVYGGLLPGSQGF